MTIASQSGSKSNDLRASNPAEMARVAAARHGNQDEFTGLTEPYRRELQVHCYRILGSRHEAEDLVQETLLRAWRRLDTYQGRASFRAWLYKIATNACLDALGRRRARRTLPPLVGPAADPRAPLQTANRESMWLEPMPDAWIVEAASGPEARYTLHESVSLAFTAALQVLPPRQRAVLILNDVLDWPARDVGELLGLTLSSVHSALHRARVTMSVRYHGQPTEAALRPLSDERTRQLLARYVSAWQNADVAGLVALLKEDAAFAMPPASSWYSSRGAIGAFAAVTVFGDEGMFAGVAKGRWQLRPVGANGQPAYVVYQRAERTTFVGFGLMVLALAGDQIAACTCFIDPALPPVFGQPLTIEEIDGTTNVA